MSITSWAESIKGVVIHGIAVAVAVAGGACFSDEHGVGTAVTGIFDGGGVE